MGLYPSTTWLLLQLILENVDGDKQQQQQKQHTPFFSSSSTTTTTLQ
jgi:hypothetical protein